MTKKIYEQDAYQKEGEASILDILEENGQIKVILDQTIFYPEGGGQPADKGTINNIQVLDVQETKGIVYHTVAARPKGPRAQMKIDWDRRFDFMQQHSGEHILSGIFHSEYGAVNKGFHLGDEIVTIDIDMKTITQDQLNHVEHLANQAIYAAKAVYQDVTDKEGLIKYSPRKQIQAEGDIRIVTIEGTDVCPCCGTHVQNSAEVGIIKILKTEAHKGMNRITFVCGARALKDYTMRSDIITKLKQALNADEESLIQRVIRIHEELQDTKYKLREQKNLIADIEFEKLMAKISQDEISHGLQDNISQGSLGQSTSNLPPVEPKKVYHVFENLDFDQIDHLVKHNLAEKESLILGSDQDKKLIAYSKNLDLGKIFKENLKAYSGRGGGRGNLAQASFDNAENLTAFIEYIKTIDL